MTRSVHSTAALILSLSLGGCASTEMTVAKVPVPTSADPHPAGPNGIRYGLPKPFLLATPSPTGDGSMKVEVVYLPDECNTYAIDARTKNGKYELTVTVKDGLLSKVSWSAKGAELMAESLKSGSEIVKAELDRQATEKKDKEDKADAVKKEAEAEIKGLEKDLNTKQLAVNVAAVELAAAQAAIDEGDASEDAKKARRTAQTNLDKASAERDFAAQLLTDARTRAAALPGALNKAQDKTGVKEGESLFWSPVLYAIEDAGDTVSLRAVEWKQDAAGSKHPACPETTKKASTAQLELLTAATPKLPADPVTPPKVLGSTDLMRIWTKPGLKLTLVLDKPVKALTETARELSLVTPDGLVPQKPLPYHVSLGADRQSIRVEFPGKPLVPGKYKITIPFTYDKDKTDSATVFLTVQS